MRVLRILHMNILEVQTLCSDHQEAASIARTLIEQSLVACANLTQADSLYTWKHELVQDSEVLLTTKTTYQHKHEIIQKVKELHSYELPYIACQEIEVTDEYGRWVAENTS